MATVLDKRTFLIVELAEISHTVPNAWTWFLCGAGRIVAGYDPYIIQLGDMVKDNGRFVRTSLTIRRNAPHRIVDNGTAKNFAGMSLVLQRYPVTGASITMKVRAASEAGDVETATTVVGKIVKPSKAGASSVTFEVELRAEVRDALAPKQSAERAAGWIDDEIPQESIGESIPVCLGSFQIAKRSLYQNASAQTMRLTLPLMGFRPSVAPAVEVNRAQVLGVSKGRFAFQERITSGRVIADPLDLTNYGLPTGFIYESAAEAYAPIWATGSNAVFDAQGAPYLDKAWTAEIPAVTWCQVPIVPKKVLEAFNVGDAQQMLDRNPYTYGVIAPSGSISIEVPQVALPWRISSNSTLLGTGTYDFEGAGVPPGIGIYILVVNPGGETLGAGQIRVEVVWPRTYNTLFGVFSDINYTATPWDLTVGRLFLPYTQTGAFGGAGDGWGGTKFHTYRFTSHPKNVATDADFPLWASGANDKKDEPFRIRITHRSGGPCYIAGIAWVLGVHHNVEAYQPSRRQTTGFQDFTGRNAGRKSYAIDGYGDVENRTYDVAPGARAAMEAAGIRIATNAISHISREKAAVSSCYVSAAGLIDDGSGTFTGTASSLIENPADLARYVLQTYGVQSSFVTTPAAAGSFADARVNLNAWAGYAGLSKWADSLLISAEMSVNDALETITTEAPGLVVGRRSDGTWKAHVWIPDSTKFANDLYSATPLDVRELALGTPEGPDLDISLADSSAVTNELSVDYSWDPGRSAFRWRAKVDRNGSDDGQGGTWPNAPGGATAQQISSWSYGQHGRRKKSLQAHGIHDGRLAAAFGCATLWRLYRQPATLRMRCGPAIYGLEPGQIFRLSNASLVAFGFEAPFWGPSTNWDGVYWEATQVEGQWERGLLSYIVQAEWRPTSIGGEVSGFSSEGEGSSF